MDVIQQGVLVTSVISLVSVHNASVTLEVQNAPRARVVLSIFKQVTRTAAVEVCCEGYGGFKIVLIVGFSNVR